jgi:hypothetical protein
MGQLGFKMSPQNGYSIDNVYPPFFKVLHIKLLPLSIWVKLKKNQKYIKKISIQMKLEITSSFIDG